MGPAETDPYGPTFMLTHRTFEKVLMYLVRPNVSKNVVKKFQQIIFKTPFWSSSKNRRLDVKVCADPSWLLVFKYGFKKCCSLKNYWVLMFEVNVKNVTEKKGRGPARVWGFDNKPSLTQVIFLMKHIFLELEAMTDLCILLDPKI